MIIYYPPTEETEEETAEKIGEALAQSCIDVLVNALGATKAMNVKELIEKHEPNPAEQFVLREFAIELLEMVKRDGRARRLGTLDGPIRICEQLNITLEELRK